LSSAEKKLLKGHTGKEVPFLLKLPFQDRGVEYRQTFNTVLSPYILIAIMRGDITSAEQAARFLDANANKGRGPSSLQSVAAARRVDLTQ
jgi:hypothetical protein